MKFITLILTLLALSASVMMADAWTSKKTVLSTKGGKVSFVCSSSGTTATCSIAGPSKLWFGVGFGTKMSGTYAIVVDTDGTVSERTLGNHTPGSALSSTISVTKNKVKGATRTVTFTRALDAGSDRFVFPAAPASFSMIAGVGPTGTTFTASTSMGGHSASGASAPKFSIK